ncbi:MAG: ATPase [Methanobacteriaceae archaeon]
MNQEVAQFLQDIGADSRFISILDNRIVVNNLRYSRFSRTREEILSHKFPDITVIRSKMFQRIATRASRNLKTQLKPKDRVAMIKDDGCASLTLYAVLEPYTRKYGIKIYKIGSWDELADQGVNKVALSLDLDVEVEGLLEKMLNGEKISLTSLKTSEEGFGLIYPLINIPQDWIRSWTQFEDIPCTGNVSKGMSAEMVQFLSSFIPDVREKMYRSALFLKENEISE